MNHRPTVMAAAIALCLTLTGCEDLFSYHPYDVRFGGETDINARNITRIETLCADKDTLRIAVMSDSHLWLGDTRAIVADINSRSGSVDFAIHLGDLTDTGTTKEFVWQRDVLSGLLVPYVALIGNHDFLGTGDEVYARMYGQMDFSFIAGRIKFVCINTNATEYDYLAAVPNFDFMEEQWTSDSSRFDRTIICMHARPYSDQFNNNVAKAFEHYVRNFKGLVCCLNGHDHAVQEDELYSDGVVYYGCDCAKHRSYLLFTITKTGYSHEIIHV